MLRTYAVFNIAQIDGLEIETPVAPHFAPHETAEMFISATKAEHTAWRRGGMLRAVTRISLLFPRGVLS